VQPATFISPTREWTKPQQRILAVLATPENRGKSFREICKLAGCKGHSGWYNALRDPQFAARVEELTGRKHRNKITTAQEDEKRERRFAEVLAAPENRTKSVPEICRLAGFKARGTWNKAMKDERFAAWVEELTGHTPRFNYLPHIDVTLAKDPEEELGSRTCGTCGG
jgi:hypothetical protein